MTMLLAACRRALAIALALLLPFTATAQPAAWPAKPIRLVVPGGPGGVLDLRARWLSERLAPALGQPLVVDPRPGAAGRIATEGVIRSTPDGYTLVLTHQGTVAVHPHLFPLAYDPVADLAHIALINTGPLVLAVHPDVPAKSVKELIDLAKARPGAMSFGSPGIGTPPHLAAELFKHLAGVNAMHVPYKGGGQAANDLVGGHVSWTVESLTVLLPYVKSGRVRPLAVTSARRFATLPEVPTLAEAGVPGYEYVGWSGIAAPAATPAPIVQRIYGALAPILASAEAREYFHGLGNEPGSQNPEAFTAFVRAEHTKWARVVRDAGIKAD